MIKIARLGGFCLGVIPALLVIPGEGAARGKGTGAMLSLRGSNAPAAIQMFIPPPNGC